MSSDRIRVLRDVEGLHVAWLDAEQTNWWARVNLALNALTAVLAVGTCLVVEPAFLIPAIALVTGLFIFESSQHRAAFHRLSISAAGLTLFAFFERRKTELPTLPSEHNVENPTRPWGLLGAAPKPVMSLAFVDIAKLGHTDNTLWFVDDDGHRTEIELPPTPYGRIQELHERILLHWASKRSGVKGPVREVQAQRARLSALTPRDDR